MSERYRYVHKIWRKLDSDTKLNYINKSRQNRYKKKSSDDKPTGNSTAASTTTTTSCGSKAKRRRSRSSTSEDNFSRSATPSVTMSMDDTNDASQHQHQSILLNRPNDGIEKKKKNEISFNRFRESFRKITVLPFIIEIFQEKIVFFVYMKCVESYKVKNKFKM